MKTLHKSLASRNDRILIDFQAENSFQKSFPFSTASVSGKKVRVAFRSGSVSSNAGVLLLRETERQVGIITSVVDCIADNRRQYSVEHSIKEKEGADLGSQLPNGSEFSLCLSRVAWAGPFHRFAGGRFRTLH